MTYLNYFSQDCLKYIPRNRLMGKRVLVVGCGDGGDCGEFIEAQEVHGLDICRNIGHALTHPKITYYQESAESMARESNGYDLVFSVATLEHIHNLEAVFAEILRVTKPGGMIYTVAAPLWPSYEGDHYENLFPEFPWIHLRLSQPELLHYVKSHKQISDLQPWIDLLVTEDLLSVPLRLGDLHTYAENVVNFMFSDYFNRQRASHYLKLARSLDVSYVIKNDLWQNGESFLQPDILQELEVKGFNREELLSVSHTYIAIK